MKQQINLYRVEKQKFVFIFNFKEALRTVLGFLALLGVVTLYSGISQIISQKTLSGLDKAQMQKEQKLQAAFDKLPSEQTRSQVMAEIKKLEEEKQGKADIIGSFPKDLTLRGGFSSYFQFLADHAVPNVWLTELLFKEGGNKLLLRGKALSPPDVTQLLSALSKGSSFKGKTFEMFRVETDPKLKQVSFTLKTKENLESQDAESEGKK